MPTAIKRALLLLAALTLTASFILPARATAPSISGECGFLFLPEKDMALYEKNAERRHPMASTTKIMTALVVIEHTDPTDTLHIPAEAVGIEGSSVYLKAGEKQTVENLLYALLLASANDAAAALAIHVGGSIEGFSEMMNKKARELGLENTHFTNPHGLYDEAHYTTASDLAHMTAAAMENETFCRIVATRHKVIRVQEGAGARSLSNHNRLLRGYEGCVGVKTGFTKKSGRCLVSAAERNGMRLIAVTLDAPDDWRDHTALLDYGYSLYEGRLPEGCAGLSLEVPVIGGTKESVAISARSTPHIIVEKGSPALEAAFEVNRFVTAPVGEGEVLGIVRYTQNGKTVATVPLLTEEAVPARPLHRGLWDKLKGLFE